MARAGAPGKHPPTAEDRVAAGARGPAALRVREGPGDAADRGGPCVHLGDARVRHEVTHVVPAHPPPARIVSGPAACRTSAASRSAWSRARPGLPP